MVKSQYYRPAGWLLHLTRLNPKTKFPWRHSTRLAVAVTAPMLIGLLAGQLEASMLVCLGALLNSVKVQTDPYRIRFRNFLIIVPMAMAGFLLGSLVAGHGLLTLAFLILMALASGLVSGYGAVYSTGAMQMLMLAVIAAAGHGASSLWLPPLLFAAGAALAALLLAIEAAFDRHHPERMALVRLLRALAHLARAAADPAQPSSGPSLATPFEQQRRHAIDAMQAAYSGLLAARLQSDGSTPANDHRAEVLATAEALFSALVAGGGSPDELTNVGHRLDAMATAVAKNGPRPSLSGRRPDEPGLASDSADRLLDEIWSETAPSDASAHAAAAPGRAGRAAATPQTRSIAERFSRLAPGREVVVSALRLALCLAIAFAAQSLLGGARSYWIPLCVVIVLKPDFGSVFVRAVQRSLGTILGVGIGVLILTLVPKGLWLIAVTALLGFLIPGAGQRGYALQCAFLTPLVLILIDLTAPGGTVDFGLPRLVDTLIGSGIALVFGYLIWPRDPAPHIHASFSGAMAAMGALLRAACGSRPTQAEIFVATMAASRSLSNLRATLQRALAEPPPASREATAWFPIVVEMERLFDRITLLAQRNMAGAVTLDSAVVERRLAILEGLGNEGRADVPPPPDDAATADGDAAFREIDGELARLTQLLAPA